jgi:hypothetical protein
MISEQLWIVSDLSWTILALNYNVFILVGCTILVVLERRLGSLADQLLGASLAMKFRMLVSVVAGPLFLIVELASAAVI